MVDHDTKREITYLTQLYEKNWGIKVDCIALPYALTQEKLCLVLRRIVNTGESILAGYEQINAIALRYYMGIDWSIHYKNGDYLKEPCPFCGEKVKVGIFGSYGQSSVVYCKTKNCLHIANRGL